MNLEGSNRREEDRDNNYPFFIDEGPTINSEYLNRLSRVNQEEASELHFKLKPDYELTD